MRIRDFRLLTFDTYGTLIDWEAGIWEALAPLAARLDAPPRREEALTAFAEEESSVQASHPELLYSDLLAAVHRRLARRFGAAAVAGESRRFGASVGGWPPFDDAPAALAYLKRHHRLITLTNCDRASYRGSARALGEPWDAVFTAEEIGAWKPSLRNFEFLLARARADFGAAPKDILHVAQSLFHDHVPAKDLGLRTAWIDRRAGRTGGATAPPPKTVEPDLQFASMAEFVARHRAEGAASGVPGARA